VLDRASGQPNHHTYGQACDQICEQSRPQNVIEMQYCTADISRKGKTNAVPAISYSAASFAIQVCVVVERRKKKKESTKR